MPRNDAKDKDKRTHSTIMRTLRTAIFAALTALTLLTACSDAEPRFSTTYPCNFFFWGDLHRGAALLRTVDNPGLYAIVTSQDRNGITTLSVSLNDGVTKETIALTTEKEQRHNYSAMGANRALIIGCSNFEGLKAWDRQCRYCLDNSTQTNFPLTFVNNGRSVKCSNCDREYNLENGISLDGHRLLEYAARYDGTLLRVNNR